MDAEKLADGHLPVLAEFPRKARIETQIHRRRGVKAFSPMMLEWEQAKPASPGQCADQE
ncbi:hypothetical protein ACYX34_04110 [Nitrospira sp. CMX1]|nr:hypothetical protein [Nitrospira sp.]